MKKSYTKPLIEIETYELSASIANTCSHKVNVGPGVPGSNEYTQCSDFSDSGFLMSIIPSLEIQAQKGIPFYSDGAANCDCYYTSGNHGYFTS